MVVVAALVSGFEVTCYEVAALYDKVGCSLVAGLKSGLAKLELRRAKTVLASVVAVAFTLLYLLHRLVSQSSVAKIGQLRPIRN